MSLDARKNFAISTVDTAPSPATSGTTLNVPAGAGSKFPAAPFNAIVWPTGANPTSSNAEIIRVTNKGSGDDWTITRQQESTSARTIIIGDQIMQGPTSKTLTDIEEYLTGVSSPTLKSPVITTLHPSWAALDQTVSVSSGYNKGNKEFDLTFSASMAAILSNGMRLKISRGTAAPTQCADFEVASTQYASRTSASVAGLTFTDDFTCEAWIKLESYGGAVKTIISRRNGGVSGFGFRITTLGAVEIYGGTASAFDVLTSHQSIPKGRWVHVAANLNMSASTGIIYIEGIPVPATYTNSGATAITNTGDLFIGAITGPAEYFDGEIAEVRLWDVVRTGTQINDNMYQQLVGTETNLVGYWPLNGNFNDLDANGNNLTAAGGAVATVVDNPFVDTEYVLVHKVNGATVTVFGGRLNQIPNMTLNAPAYSISKIPLGWPAARYNWSVETLSGTNTTISSAGTKLPGLDMYVPTGEWLGSCRITGTVARTGGTGVTSQVGISTSATAFTEETAINGDAGKASAQPFGCGFPTVDDVPIGVLSQTVYYVVVGGTFTTSDPNNASVPSTGSGVILHRFLIESAYA